MEGGRARQLACHHSARSCIALCLAQHTNPRQTYFLVADHRIEIVADRGLAGLVSDEQWRGVCVLMEERLRSGDAEGAAIAGIEAASDLLARHFPRQPGDADENELPDLPHLS